LGFFGIDFFDAANTLYGLGVFDIAANSINGIRWINNDPAFFQAIYNHSNLTFIRIFRMYLNQHIRKGIDFRSSGIFDHEYGFIRISKEP
jgi:hypothetical protein